MSICNAGVVGEGGLDLLRPFQMGALVLEIDPLTAAAADIVAGLAGDRRPGLRVDDPHVGEIVLDAETRRQELARQAKDDHAHLFEDAVRVAELIDELFLSRAPADGDTRPVQPKPYREGTADPRRADVAALLDKSVRFAFKTGEQELNQIALALKQDEGQTGGKFAAGHARVIGGHPVLDEFNRACAIILLRSKHV